MQVSTKQKFSKSITIIAFALILIVSFVFINTTGGLIFGNSKLDLTADKINTLSPQTTKLLQKLKHPVLAKVYLSEQISKELPLQAQYAQLVLRILEQYKKQSGGMIKVEIVNPVPYTTTEDEAKSGGIIPFDNNADERIYFGAVFSNDDGKSYTIPQFNEIRQNYLENDITRAIANISGLVPETIGIASNLQIYDDTYHGQKEGKDWAFINLLKKDYNLVSVSTGAAEIPQNIKTLIVVNTNKLPAVFIYALDQYILRGGNLIVILDPFSEIENKINGFTEQDGPNIHALLANLGINYTPDKILADYNLAQTAEVETPDGIKKQKYAPWIKFPSTNINSSHPLTSGLSAIEVRTPGALRLEDQDGYKTAGLFWTSENTGLIDAPIARYENKAETLRYIEPQEDIVAVGAFSQGEYKTIFKESPIANSDYAKQIMPFLVVSVQPAKIIAVADSDFLNPEVWARTIAGKPVNDDIHQLASVNNNFDFIQRSVDYLSGNDNFLNVANKDISDRTLTIAKETHDEIFKKYQEHYNEVKQNMEQNQKKIDTINSLIKNRDVYSSAKTLSDLDTLQRQVLEDQEELRGIDYKVKTETQQKIEDIILLNTLGFPLIILLLIIIINLWLNIRTRRKAGRLANE